MADKRINDLPALVTQVGNDVYEMSNNAGSLSSKETRTQMLNYTQANISVNLATNVSGILSPTNGGTGVSNPTAHGILVGEGSSAAHSLVLTNGEVLIGSTGLDPVPANLSSGAGINIINGAGSITISATGGVTTLQNAYDNGNGTITVENTDNTKPFAVGRNETNLLAPYGVYVSATRNLQASPSKPWFHFFEALDNSSTNTQFGAIACDVLDGTAGAVAGKMLFGAAVPGDAEVVPFLGANGQTSHCETYFDIDSINDTAVSSQNIINHNFVANNSSAALKTYAALNSYLFDNTAGAEDGILNLQVIESGTLLSYIQLLGSVGTIGINKPTIYSAFLNINGQNIVNAGNITTASSPNASAQLQLTSTSKGALLNTLTTAQFAAISSPATGLIAYDTDKLRYTSWNGSSVKDLAYTSDITGQSGTYVPTFSGASGGNTFSLIKALYSAQSTASGSVVNVTMQFTYTATAGSAAISISLPIGTTFSSTGQAALSGGEIYGAIPAIGDGLLINVDTIATQTTVTATWIVAVATGSKTINLSFAYQIQ